MKTFPIPTQIPQYQPPSLAPSDGFNYILASSPAVLLVIDWVAKGKFGPVQNQGDCGACWTFSVLGSIEGGEAILKNKPPVKYSAQQLLDCCSENVEDCGDCTGSWTGYAY